MIKVTVVIPTCNRPELLRRAIKSVLKQSLQDFEIIVIDDGFKKSSKDVVLSFNDPRLRYIKNEKQRGGGGSRNVGIQNAHGEYIAFLDDDDEWYEDKLMLQVQALDKVDKDVCVAFCGLEMVNTDNQVIRTISLKEKGVVNPFERLLRRPYIWTSVIMFRTSCRDFGGFFDENLTKNQEWDLTLRLSWKNSFFAIDRPLVRLHILGEDEHMGGTGNMPNIIKGNLLFLRKYEEEYKTRPKAHAMQLFRLAGFYYENREFRYMRQNLYRAWKLHPTNMIYCKHFFTSLFGDSMYKFFRK